MPAPFEVAFFEAGRVYDAQDLREALTRISREGKSDTTCAVLQGETVQFIGTPAEANLLIVPA